MFQACLMDVKPSEVYRRLTTKKKHSKYVQKDQRKQLEDLVFDLEWSDSFKLF